MILRNSPHFMAPLLPATPAHTLRTALPQAQPDNSVWRASESGSWVRWCRDSVREGHLRDWLKRTENILYLWEILLWCAVPGSRFLSLDEPHATSERQGLLQEQVLAQILALFHQGAAHKWYKQTSTRTHLPWCRLLLLMSTETFSYSVETYLHFNRTMGQVLNLTEPENPTDGWTWEPCFHWRPLKANHSGVTTWRGEGPQSCLNLVSARPKSGFSGPPTSPIPGGGGAGGVVKCGEIIPSTHHFSES